MRRDQAALAERGVGSRRRRRGAAREEPAGAHRARSCARSRRRRGSRSPARRSRTASATCGRSSTGPPRACSARSRRSAARSRCPSNAPATRSRPSTSPDSSGRSCCAGASRIRRSRPSCRPRPRPTSSSRSPPSRSRSTRRWCARRWPRSADAEGIARRGLVLKLLTALKQITNHPAQYLGQREPLARPLGQARRVRRAGRRHRRRGRLGARLHPVRRDGAPPRAAPREPWHRRRSSCTAACAPRAAEDMVDEFQAGEVPRVPALAQGGRSGAQPHAGDPRRALRPLVEPRGRGPGHRPRLPHRAGPAGAGAPAHLRGDRRGPDRRAARHEARAGGRGGRRRRGVDQRAVRRRPRRARRARPHARWTRSDA